MSIDPTISIGHIIQILAILAGGFYFIWEMRTKMLLLANAGESVARRLDKVDMQLEKLAGVTIDLARQEERMTAQDLRIQELSNRLDDDFRVFSLGKTVDRNLKRRKPAKS